MQRIMLRSKIHRVTATPANLDHEDSCGIDEKLLEAADIRIFGKIGLYNINNGERLPTCAVNGAQSSGEIWLNEAATRRAHHGDFLTISTDAPMRAAKGVPMCRKSSLLMKEQDYGNQEIVGPLLTVSESASGSPVRH